MVKTMLRLIVLVTMLAVVFAYAMFQGGFASWFLFYGVLTVVVVTLVVSLVTLRGFVIERKMDKEMIKAGETLIVQVIIKKRVLQPFYYVRVQDLPPAKLGETSESGSLFFFSFQRTLRFSYPIKNVKRGSYTFRELELVFSDLFGLFEKRHIISCESEVLVYPYYEKLVNVPANKNLYSTEGALPNNYLEEERSLAGVRSYIPGDRLASIDWKQSARTTELKTKEFESFRGSGIVVAFDPFYKRSSDELFEKAIEAAASLMVTFVEKQATLKVAVCTEDWQGAQISQYSLPLGLRLFANVDRRKEPAPAVHRFYKEWQGETVYYVCVELAPEMIAALKTMRAQQAAVQLCLISKTEKDRVVAKELERLGIKTYTLSSSE